jgi:hypothetical protein
MPDITMCSGNNCEMSSICYRYKAEPTERQSYFVKPPNKGLICDYFWEIKCEYCHQTNGVHKMSCPTQKIEIRL